MKRTKVLVLMFALVTLLAGCGNSSNEASNNTEAATTPTQSETAAEEPDANRGEDQNTMENAGSNVLIAYFSRIGNIDSEHEIDAISSASVVTQGEDILGNMDDYDTVFLGFPNWYGDMPMAVYSFLEEYDMSGKKVYLFHSSGGGGARDAYSEVSDLESDAQVEKNIFSISHSQVSELTDQDMQDWLSETGYGGN